VNRVALITATAFAVAGCGGADKPKSPPAGKADSSARLEQAAERLDGYLRDHTRKLGAQDVEPGHLISFVEPFQGTLKISLRAASDYARNHVLGPKLCKLVERSGVPEASGAYVVDMADGLFKRC
jgi:hypothetical protein